jgi:hypothetical protein
VLTAQELLAEADGLISGGTRGASATWPRAAAVLTRQALELTVGERLARVDPELREASMRSQLTCLRAIAKDTDAAASASYAWASLSSACHYHPYELAPSAPELRALMITVADITRRLH